MIFNINRAAFRRTDTAVFGGFYGTGSKTWYRGPLIDLIRIYKSSCNVIPPLPRSNRLTVSPTRGTDRVH